MKGKEDGKKEQEPGSREAVCLKTGENCLSPERCILTSRCDRLNVTNRTRACLKSGCVNAAGCTRRGYCLVP